jgi:ribosomal protein S18 acetylase RimI-like enzyme
MSTGSKSNLEYTLATPGDVTAYLKFEQLVATPPCYVAIIDPASALKEITENKLFFVKKDGVLSATTAYKIREDGSAYISDIAVIPAERGRGLGRAVTEYVLDIVKDYPRVDLVTHPKNPAQNLYKSLGFEVEREVPNYFGDGEPRLVMVLKK